ncbi:transcriptional regulator [Alcaligenes sp. HPC1271]|nr:helix-turn-helix transcriptional regulator [Alcaligenes sp. HPC1271]EKU29207.1 transcriptional regulator [Alcaligenes sp. HPC1271]
MKHFSDRLRHARLQRGFSQAELARLCNLSQSAISNYESGTRRDAREILDLAKA